MNKKAAVVMTLNNVCIFAILRIGSWGVQPSTIDTIGVN